MTKTSKTASFLRIWHFFALLAVMNAFLACATPEDRVLHIVAAVAFATVTAGFISRSRNQGKS